MGTPGARVPNIINHLGWQLLPPAEGRLSFTDASTILGIQFQTKRLCIDEDPGVAAR